MRIIFAIGPLLSVTLCGGMPPIEKVALAGYLTIDLQLLAFPGEFPPHSDPAYCVVGFCHSAA